MNKIRVLPDTLSNQIAAGEVVERPASVVKELVENSIDAGATKVQVDIELGGRRLIRVSDNGEGMSRDDAILSFERHATSKIKELEDLGRISTLGFRGEALASIASVAKVELVTKTEEQVAATKVIIEGGKLIDVKDAAHPTGTTISVRDLFFNTPARRKFMRSEATENYHLTSILTHYALANPSISFVLTNNGREIIRVSPARELRERAYQLFGSGLLESMLRVEGGREFVASIQGFVSAPRERRTTRDSQYFFINGRFVKDKLLASALSEGYRAVLPHGSYPVAFLFLDLPLEEIDVNVHPAKTEVRFRRAEAVKDVIAMAVREALSSNGYSAMARSEPVEAAPREQHAFPAPVPVTEQPRIDFGHEVGSFTERDAVHNAASPPITADAELEVEGDGFERYAASRDHRDGPEPGPQRPITLDVAEQTSVPEVMGYRVMPPVDSALKFVREAEVKDLSNDIAPIGQLHESYIIAVDREGLLLVDQHVAHERILFDKFRRREGGREVQSQNLLLPETFDLTPAQALAFEVVEPELESLGFSLMRLSGRTVAIKAIPADLPPKETRNLLGEILDTVDREKQGNSIETIRDDIAASMACKAAVKVNMKLTSEKMRWLIDNLLINSAVTTCPHGRPIILRLTMRDIERGFHRR
jgi:DNA mismatch repair protein MutL